LPPVATVCTPGGVTLPPAPEVAVMVAALAENVALIVWGASTLENVNVPDDTAAGFETPSTSTSRMR